MQPQEASKNVSLKTMKWTAVGYFTVECVRPEKQGHHWWHAHCLGFVNVTTHPKQVLFASWCLLSRASNRCICNKKDYTLASAA